MATEPSIVFYLSSAASLDLALAEVAKITPTNDTPYTLRLSQNDESRSLKQNRLSFLWYRIRGEATGHGKDYERHLCKLRYGISILCRDKDFNEFYHQSIARLDYETRLAAMEYIPVTSLMSVKQFAEYLNTVDEESADLGILLPRPDDLYWAALMIEADHHV